MLATMTAARSTAQTLLLDGFDRVVERVPDVVDGLSNDELLWRPDGEANPIGWLLWHLARQADVQIAALSERETVWAENGWAERFALPYDQASMGYGMSSADVGAFTITDPALFAKYQSAVHERTTEVVDSLGDDDYEKVIDDSYDPPVTVGVRVLSVLDDASKHLGQAEYVKGMVERRRAL